MEGIVLTIGIITGLLGVLTVHLIWGNFPTPSSHGWVKDCSPSFKMTSVAMTIKGRTGRQS
jgi:hypothetical protein